MYDNKTQNNKKQNKNTTQSNNSIILQTQYNII